MTRTSKTGWLPDAFHPVVDTVTSRSSAITKLRADTWRDESELLQVIINDKDQLIYLDTILFVQLYYHNVEQYHELFPFYTQVANYINGGHYNPHHDYVMKDKDPNHVSK